MSGSGQHLPARDRTTDLIATRLDLEKYYVEVEGLEGWTSSGGEQYLALCPFHEDHDPSLSIGPKGLFHCFACKEGGSVFDFYMKRHNVSFKEARLALAEVAGVAVQGSENQEPLDDTDVKLWVEALWKNPRVLKFLREERGLTDTTIREWKLGWTGDRISIPIVDVDTILVNVRKYRPHAKPKQAKTIGLTGYNRLRLFPATFDAAQAVIIGEGEIDAILGRQEGFNIVTATLGAGSWDPAWNALFTGCDVIMCLDNDDQGRRGTDKILGEHGLDQVVKSARVVAWPEDFKEKGDITDFFMVLGRSPADFQSLLDSAEPWSPPKESTLPDFELTDIGNSQRFVYGAGKDLLYCNVTNQWFAWDGTSWRVDEVRRVQQLAKELLLRLTEETDPVVDQGLLKHLRGSQHESRVKAMVNLATSDPELAIHPSQLDQQLWLLTVDNGTVDLKTGELRESRRMDLTTARTGAAYDPAAKSAAWDKLLEAVTEGDKDMQAFLQRAIGYSLTGDVSEEKLFFIWGPTQSGKSTFLEAIRRALGEYAMQANFATFLDQKFGQSSEGRSDIVRMRGKRFVTSIEVEEGKKLAEGLIKTLTGGDTISARFLYKEAFEYSMTSKLWLAANHKPRISDDDDAIWRRILLVPFDKTIANPDPKIKEELLNVECSGAAILAWAVQGCLDWQRQGLGNPAKVAAATKSYRAEQDPITDWFEERVRIADGGTTSGQDLYTSYRGWCDANRVNYPIAAKTLNRRLLDRGYECFIGSGNKRMFRGLVLAITNAAQSSPRRRDGTYGPPSAETRF